MSRNYADQPPEAMRRSDRAVEDTTWIQRFLHRAPVGSLATVYGGQPFINTNIFYYDEDEHCIYLHTARVGRTRANVDANDRACFSVMEMGRLLPAPEALEFSVEYAGVTVFGSITVVDDPDEALHVLQRIMDKYAPHLKAGMDYRPPVEEERKRTAVYKLMIQSWSGKKKEVAPDFPGAYWYDLQPMLASLQTDID